MVRTKLQALITERRLSQREVARLSGVRPRTVNLLCSNRMPTISFEVIDGLCGALKIQPGDLFERVPETEKVV